LRVTVNVKFRKAAVTDWEQLYRLLEHMGLVRDREKSRALFENYVSRAHHCIIIAENNQDLLGYAWAQSYGAHLRTSDVTARLNDLFILPDYRKKGIAKGLLESVITWAQENNIKYLQWQANKSSAAFYERLGYVSIPDPDPEHPFLKLSFS
jgi:GNAT superfamily N-acetyltransferase